MVNIRHFPFQTCQGMLQVLEGAQEEKGPFFPVLLVSFIIRSSRLQRTMKIALQACLIQGCRKQARCYPGIHSPCRCWTFTGLPCLGPNEKWSWTWSLLCREKSEATEETWMYPKKPKKVWFLEIIWTKVKLSLGSGRFFILLEKHQRILKIVSPIPEFNLILKNLIPNHRVLMRVGGLTN